ncbi:MAG: hypothetical protein ABIZ81_14945 [Opitutaceae bacterium]
MINKILSPRFLSLAALAAAVAVSGCAKKERVDASTTAQGMYNDTKNAMANAWGDVKDYTFEKKSDFEKSAKSMSASMEAQLSAVRANYSEAKASASRKAAMAELKSSEADYKDKVDALGKATAATWDSAKQNVVAAWDKLQASYLKARAE